MLLVLGFIDWIQKPDYGVLDMMGLFGVQLAIGTAIGLALGWLFVKAFRRLHLASEGLYPVASLAAAALAFGAADTLHGSGFLAVYLVGLALGTDRTVSARPAVTAFHDGLAWIAQLTMFFTLGLLVFPSQFGDVAIKGGTLAIVLERFTARERLALGWAGLRGAVPVVLATFPVIEGVPHSLEFFNIVFFAVLLSTLLQGSTFEPLANRLGVTTTEPALPPGLREAPASIRAGGRSAPAG